ncbi:hypothetical protein A2276_01110 [candidate division WOR-1 bacterium RIFOXYA12_FULL_43_27]|uniref:Aromatic hydrocarbon degradation protein n=1 Tax=candidate division WOR-1 bacterium RIFOXYC2_FULL_46_14 TaxID=1802587 RepID=A0A1F4U4R0_UNCSA|nr:MAG: hypothetical protein A2276_01110 [candidate division WOR-1 bacterium RIFOXYA12_FULL_43_27]OGC20715.1 MAG: hypothetical protein A2292_06765 [candidate division WOR-1 bacterium RIFOXYB2_FULL_46_45]OGC31548.1 MAG: hypothetical protein A2232_04685 [candidate division WOR-1 bacterium RIFOXYA2_FULL_46_56]OGC39955.1 MAG: hypothetical protein A2438_05525 [candidate division WOR-1 bacterium RIFOXYC2_FULL_46_14]
MKSLKLTTLMVTILALLATLSYAEKTTVDLSIAGLSARTIAMGRAYVGVADGADALFTNPAGIATAKSWGITSMQTKLLDRVDYKMLGGIYSLQTGVIGVGYIGAVTPAGFLTTDKASLTGATPISYGSNMLVLSYGKEAYKNTYIGASLKALSNNFEGVDGSGSGFDLDLGILARPNDQVKVGAVIQNILPGDMGGSVTWKTNTKDTIPAYLKVGGSYLLNPNILIAADLDIPASCSAPLALHSGVEWKPLPMLALRGGLDQSSTGKNETVTDFAIGVGLNVAGFSFDYAYKNNSLVENNNAHYISVAFSPDNIVKKAPPLVEQQAKKANPNEPAFASEKERNEYLYLVATGKTKAPVPAVVVTQAKVLGK